MADHDPLAADPRDSDDGAYTKALLRLLTALAVYWGSEPDQRATLSVRLDDAFKAVFACDPSLDRLDVALKVLRTLTFAELSRRSVTAR